MIKQSIVWHYVPEIKLFGAVHGISQSVRFKFIVKDILDAQYNIAVYKLVEHRFWKVHSSYRKCTYIKHLRYCGK